MQEDQIASQHISYENNQHEKSPVAYGRPWKARKMDTNLRTNFRNLTLCSDCGILLNVNTFTTAQAAERLRCSPRTVRLLATKLGLKKRGSEWFFFEPEVKAIAKVLHPTVGRPRRMDRRPRAG